MEKGQEVIAVREPTPLSSPADELLSQLGTVERLDSVALGNHATVLWQHFQPLNHRNIPHLPRLRVIVCPATGLDHIDLEACKERGIEVLSLQGETEFLRTIPATAEHTWALILALTRRVPWAFDAVRGQADANRLGFMGTDLKGKRLGILGLGRVGYQVLQIGRAFGMDVLWFDPYRRKDATSLKGRMDSLEGLCRQSDILTIHVPLNDETDSMVGWDALQALPWGAFVVNTARGPVVYQDALLNMLMDGRLAGVALDFPTPLAVGYAQGNSNLLLTPHLGGCTKESMERVDVFMAEKLKRWLEAR